ncbi:predicted protein [Histoplasma mississippiense (nom. inval.)]|uniref:predicted protein n=1 Tax=Ajellomyces capsulatus (strain NAm1 / WU24) TaxID=2059318 RepID=UPI000157D403|nr:predicted protein [Histoplasma mississippiense (nom. inval.)]EDN04568.1 predicted protein [Histoplasma mississippiense (nom. inval.)]
MGSANPKFVSYISPTFLPKPFFVSVHSTNPHKKYKLNMPATSRIRLEFTSISVSAVAYTSRFAQRISHTNHHADGNTNLPDGLQPVYCHLAFLRSKAMPQSSFDGA